MNYIKIDPERVLSDIDRNIFGGYLEKGIYGGIYAPEHPLADKNGLRSDIKAALDRMNLPNIRWGGNFFSGYHWKDGVGSPQERVARQDLAWRTFVSNQFGTDEFIKFCRTLKAAPYMNVNCGDGFQQIGRGRTADALDALGEGQIAAVLALGANVAHDRIARHLQEGCPHAQQEDAAQENPKIGHHHGRDHQRSRVESQTQKQQFLLADSCRKQTTGHAEHRKSNEDRK